MKIGRAILIILIAMGTVLTFAVQTAALYIGAAVVLLVAVSLVVYFAERKKIQQELSAPPQHGWTIWRRAEPHH